MAPETVNILELTGNLIIIDYPEHLYMHNNLNKKKVLFQRLLDNIYANTNISVICQYEDEQDKTTASS